MKKKVCVCVCVLGGGIEKQEISSEEDWSRVVIYNRSRCIDSTMSDLQ